ncbi:MAG: hypothetical protein HETSPECPRED_000614 [Heterodermia speciosa]|uniref:Uncharacterized protein n=1 Tax=Heterodermia speciosa TaxID=116794 RepID=A0A8H3GCN7_9LECA|nr:MAG: hypothetical protein HETSPECPRED_000614 [Heterodermia speciosa]
MLGGKLFVLASLLVAGLSSPLIVEPSSLALTERGIKDKAAEVVFTKRDTDEDETPKNYGKRAVDENESPKYYKRTVDEDERPKYYEKRGFGKNTN